MQYFLIFSFSLAINISDLKMNDLPIKYNRILMLRSIYNHSTKPIISYHADHNRDEGSKIYEEIGINTSSVLTFAHTMSKNIRNVGEFPRYTLISFISDVGGILGVFLGISFWSLYLDLVKPILDKVETSLRKTCT